MMEICMHDKLDEWVSDVVFCIGLFSIILIHRVGQRADVLSLQSHCSQNRMLGHRGQALTEIMRVVDSAPRVHGWWRKRPQPSAWSDLRLTLSITTDPSKPSE